VSNDVSDEHIASIFRVEKTSWARKQRESRWQRWRRYVPSKRLTSNGLHGVISEKMVLFITTAVRSSNPRSLHLFVGYITSDGRMTDETCKGFGRKLSWPR
jgi:hypothetical protein